MVTVAEIAKSAFDSVAASITDAVKSGTLSDGVANHVGRFVLGGETAPSTPSGLPVAMARDKTREAYLEGFGYVAQIGDTLTDGAETHHILSSIDIVGAGGFVVSRVIADEDMLWQSVTFQNATKTPDGGGGFSEVWEDVATVQAGIAAVSGQERMASMRIEAISKWRLWCKPVAGITEESRVMIDGQAYNINFVNDVEKRGVWTVLDLSGGVAT